jgi:membrane protease YdiL (CAAX protease family)
VTRRYPDLKNSAILCVLFLAFQVIVSLFMIQATGSKGLMIVASVLVPPLGILAIAARANRATLGSTLAWGGVHIKTIVPIVFMTLSLVVIISEIENIVIRYLIGPDLYRDYLGRFMDLLLFDNGTDLVFGSLSIALVGPLMEEAVFRGVIYRGIASHRGPTFAVMASSILFMVIHINPLQFVGALTLGLVYATMISRGYRISDTFVAHALHNTLSLAFLMGAIEVPGMNPATGGDVVHVPAPIVGASLAVFVLSFPLVLAWAPGRPSGGAGEEDRMGGGGPA